ncbi:uncharacterized protein LOC128157728 isoform X2 [Crassostrea angulata]|uniref:uncharacterized protein LOC128157728 isoform X2 n=1 Tax=Magallana angulata TaxID=2784310 RepID=UPI0022B218BF|nr:uncharacterized protein LOC128157728 isoform X2 [Crassostrea angulata]
MCCSERNKNEVKRNNRYSDECRVSIQTIWRNRRENQHIHILEKNTCIKHGKKEYEVKDIHLSITNFSDTQTDAILNFEEKNNSIILRELKDAVSDLLISTKLHRSVVVISEESSVYLCVNGIHKKICIIAKCIEKENCFKNNETKSNGTKDMQFSLTDIWKQWKGEVQMSINQ